MNFKNGLAKLSFLSLILCLLVITLSSTPERYDVLIKNTKIVDGTGKAAFKGNIAIKGEKIVAVGKVKGDAATIIDGTGLVTSPGFIDPHSHADLTIMKYPLAENLVMQGITSFLGGNCGSSPAPLATLTFGEWLSKVEEEGISLNYAPLVAHGVIRSLVMGKDFRRKATSEEIEEMKKYMEEAMRSGAIGFSGGLDYDPGRFADTEELIELAKVASKYGGLYVPHTRHMNSQWPTDDPEEVSYGLYYGPPEDVWAGRYRGYLEALEISRKAKIPLHIAHFSKAYKLRQPHPDFLEEAAAKATLVEIIDKARKEGLDVTFDTIPWSATVGGKTPMIDAFYSKRVVGLNWVQQIEKEEFIQRLNTREFRDRLRRVDEKCRLKLGWIHTKVDPYWMDCFKILTCKNKEYEGKTIGDIARMRNTDPLEMIFDILVEDPETTWVQFLDRRFAPAAIPVFLKHPIAMPCTDVIALSAKPEPDSYQLYSTIPYAPISYGLFPHYIGTYVREKAVLSLEEAVRKATYLPAQRFGLKDRGVLSPGAYADIVVFDFEKIKMKGDFLDPAQPPEGILYVLVNGKVVYKEKAHTGLRPGKVLRNKF